MRLYRALLVIAIVLTAIHETGAQISPLDLVTTDEFVPYSRFATSPDSTLVAYSIVRAAVRKDAGTAQVIGKVAELWIIDLRSNLSQRICCDDGGSALSPEWSPDGQYVAFYRSVSAYAFSKEGREKFSSEAFLEIWNRMTGTRRDYAKGILASHSIYVGPLWLTNSSVLILAHPTTNSITNATQEHQATGVARRTGLDQRSQDPTIRVLVTSELEQSDQLEQSGDNVDQDDKQSGDELKALIRSDGVVVDLIGGVSKTVLTNIYPYHWTLSPDRTKFVYANFRTIQTKSYFYTQDVHVFDLNTLEDHTLLSGSTMYSASWNPFTWSADGRFFAFNEETQVNDGRKYLTFVLMELTDGLARRIKAATPSNSFLLANRAVWSGDGQYVSLIRDNQLETWSSRTIHLVSKVMIRDSDILEIVCERLGWAPGTTDGKPALLVKVRDRETLKEGFWRVRPLAKRADKLLEDDKGSSDYATFAELLPDGRHSIFLWESVDHPPNLYEADTDLRNVRQVTHLNGALESMRMGRTRIVTWRNREGKKRRGSLLLPSEYVSGRKYPLIVSVYPLADMVNSKNLFGMKGPGPVFNWQLFATRGYAVFMPNIPTRPASKMTDIATNVLPGIEQLVRMGVADQERIGVIGHSDGGYGVLALLVQSDIFKSGIMSSGYGNQFEFYATEHGRRFIGESWKFKTTPWASRRVFIGNSPYFYLDRVKAPLLIVHGSADVTVEPQLAREVFAGLRSLGKQAEYVEYQDEDHFPDDYSLSHQLDDCHRMIAWFDRYLMETKGEDDSPQAIH